MKLRIAAIVAGACLFTAACTSQQAASQPNPNSCAIPPGMKQTPQEAKPVSSEVQKSDAEWRKILTPEQYEKFLKLRESGPQKRGPGVHKKDGANN